MQPDDVNQASSTKNAVFLLYNLMRLYYKTKFGQISYDSNGLYHENDHIQTQYGQIFGALNLQPSESVSRKKVTSSFLIVRPLV